jgi:hypothetical protein
MMVLLFLGSALEQLSSQDKARSLCVAPLPLATALTAATPDLGCSISKLWVHFDGGERIPSPYDRCRRVESLAVDVPRKVVVSCDRKPQQSFKFRFATYRLKQPCLFLNDFYNTVQLWDSKKAP